MKALESKSSNSTQIQNKSPFFGSNTEKEQPFFSQNKANNKEPTIQTKLEEEKSDKDKNIEKGQSIATFEFMIGLGGGVKIIVNQDLTNGYVVKDVTSSSYGITLGFSWEQSTYTVNIEKNIATIDVYGILNYNIIVEGLGTLYSESKHFKVKTNTTNGNEVGLSIIK